MILNFPDGASNPRMVWRWRRRESTSDVMTRFPKAVTGEGCPATIRRRAGLGIRSAPNRSPLSQQQQPTGRRLRYSKIGAAERGDRNQERISRWRGIRRKRGRSSETVSGGGAPRRGWDVVRRLLSAKQNQRGERETDPLRGGKGFRR